MPTLRGPGQTVVFLLAGLLGLLALGLNEGWTKNKPIHIRSADFENADVEEWETFVTLNGTLGGEGFPSVGMFPTVEDGPPSRGLQFKVGKTRFYPKQETLEGGGLSTRVRTKSGLLLVSAHVAVTYQSPVSTDRRNLAGGQFEWVINDRVVSSFDAGPIPKGSVTRHRFQGRQEVPAGVHHIQLRITRPFISPTGKPAPFQVVDDLMVQFLPNP